MLGRSWGDGVDGLPGMPGTPGTASPYAEWPEWPGRLRLEWNGFALDGLPGMGRNGYFMLNFFIGIL